MYRSALANAPDEYDAQAGRSCAARAAHTRGAPIRADCRDARVRFQKCKTPRNPYVRGGFMTAAIVGMTG